METCCATKGGTSKVAEGHTIHALAARLNTAFAGQPVRVGSPQHTFAAEAGRLNGHEMRQASAHGKNLLVAFADAPTLHVHLGMFGSFSVRAHERAIRDGWLRTEPPASGAERLRLLTLTHLGDLRRPMQCRLLDDDGVAALLDRLGPDPLAPEQDPDAAVRVLHRSRREIGLLLVDQSVVAGIGNVYRAELLFRAGLSPWLPGSAVDLNLLRTLWSDATYLMSIGTAAGWIITDTRQVEQAAPYLDRGERVPRWPKVYAVYGRAGQPCRRCGTPIDSAAQGRQRIFWCPRCQPFVDD